MAKATTTAAKEKEAEIILANITAAEKEEFREAFRLFDKDGDGQVTVKEIHDVFQSLGFKKFTRSDIRKMVSAQDMDGNETIDLDEFIVMLRVKRTGKYEKLTFEQELKRAFKVFDLDGDGSITASELSRIMKALGENLSRKDIEFMIKAVDIDNNGEIEFEEFKRMMTHAPVAQNTIARLGTAAAGGGDKEKSRK